MNTTLKIYNLGFAAKLLSRQFRRATTIGLMIGMTASGAVAQGLSLGGSIGGIGGSLSLGGGSVASVGGSIGSIGGSATVGGSTAAATANVGVGTVAGATASVLAPGQLATVCVQANGGNGCAATRPATGTPVPGQPPVSRVSLTDQQIPPMPRSLFCAKTGGITSFNGFTVLDRSGTFVGWVKGAKVTQSGKIAGLTILSSSSKCLSVSGGSFVANGTQVTSNMDASLLQ